MTDLSLSLFLFAFLFFVSFSLPEISDRKSIAMLPLNFSIAGIIFSVALSIDFGVKTPFMMAESRALAFHLILPFISGAMGSAGGLALGEKRKARVVGAVMTEASITFLLYSFEHPEMSFPWNNAVSYAIYGLWLIAAVIMIFIPCHKD